MATRLETCVVSQIVSRGKDALAIRHVAEKKEYCVVAGRHIPLVSGSSGFTEWCGGSHVAGSLSQQGLLQSWRDCNTFLLL
jgi:hypothetical protein